MEHLTNWKIRKKPDHFLFSFKNQNLQDLLSFQFALLDSDTKKSEFVEKEKK